MFNNRGKLKYITLLAIMILALCFLGVNGNGQQGGNTNVFEPEASKGTDSRKEIPTEVIVEPEVDVEPEQKQTGLDVLLVDNINGSSVKMKNCIVRLVGEMNLAEDMWKYDNLFVDGHIYKITILLQLKEEEENIE